MKPHHGIESTLDFDLGPLRVRMWLEEESGPPVAFPHLTKLASEIQKLIQDRPSSNVALLQSLADLDPRISAVQLQQMTSHSAVWFGTVIYTKPF